MVDEGHSIEEEDEGHEKEFFLVELTRRRFRQKLRKWIGERLNFVVSEINNLFIDNLPSDDMKELPPVYMYGLGSLMYFGMIAIFLSVFLTTFFSSKNLRFLSITTTGMKCEPVYKPLSGSYLVDLNGNWEGSSEFVYTEAVYKFQLNSFQGPQELMTYIIGQAMESAKYTGNMARNKSLPLNLLNWIAFQGTITLDGHSHIFQYAGSSGVVFNKEHEISGLANVDGDCGVRPVSRFDKSSSVMSINFPYDLYSADPNCMRILNPLHAGYDAQLDGNEFTLNINVDSLVSALAVNIDLYNPASELNKVPSSDFTVSYGNTTAMLAKYYYPRFPQMTPMICLALAADNFLCSVRVAGDLYALPVFNHRGRNNSNPMLCECDETFYNKCNAFELLSGLIFYEYDETGSMDDSYYSLMATMYAYNSTVEIFDKLAINATFDAVTSNNVYKNDAAWRKKAYEFCSETAGLNTRCSVLAFLQLDADSYVTDNQYQIFNLSCSDTFSISPEAEEKLKMSSPQPLTEVYYQCQNSLNEVVNNSIGIATGSMGTYIPIIALIAVLVLKFYFYLKGENTAKTYSKPEREEILDFLAFNLLLARDGRYSLEEDPSQSILLKLKSELGKKEFIDRFYSENSSSSTENSTEIELQAINERQSSVKQRIRDEASRIFNPMFVQAQMSSDNEEGLFSSQNPLRRKEK